MAPVVAHAQFIVACATLLPEEQLYELGTESWMDAFILEAHRVLIDGRRDVKYLIEAANYPDSNKNEMGFPDTFEEVFS